MKKYDIPIRWESYRRYPVQAENLQEAVKIALKQFLAEPDPDYINDSFEIDEITEEEVPDETFDINQIIQEL